jgi:TonB family protein
MWHRSALLALLAWGGGAALSAQVPLDCTPPRFERFSPAVVVSAELSPEAVGTAPVAVVLDAGGLPWGSRLDAEGDPLPAPEPGEETNVWRPARDFERTVAGALWVSAPCSFHFALDEATVQPPQPRFQIPRVAAEKFELLARVREKGVLRARVRVSAAGNLERIEVWDESLTREVRRLFAAVAPRGPAFAPARDRATGRAVAVEGEFRWDLRPSRPGGTHWETDLIAWDTLTGPATDFVLYVAGNGQGGVRDAFAGGGTAEHPDLREVLLSALVLPLASSSEGAEERWLLRTDPTAGTVRKVSAEPVSRRAPQMLQAPRPEYPRRLWRRGPEGFVYVRFVIETDGRVNRIEILESTEQAFANEARATLEDWTFEPMHFDGRPIRSEVIMTLPFRLPRR